MKSYHILACVVYLGQRPNRTATCRRLSSFSSEWSLSQRLGGRCTLGLLIVPFSAPRYPTVAGDAWQVLDQLNGVFTRIDWASWKTAVRRASRLATPQLHRSNALDFREPARAQKYQAAARLCPDDRERLASEEAAEPRPVVLSRVEKLASLESALRDECADALW